MQVEDANLLTQIFIAIACIGTLIFTVYSINQNTNAQKATLLKELYLMVFDNQAIRETFYLIDNNDFKYIKTDFDGKPIEQNIDFLLGFCDLVCELHKQKRISDVEIRFFNYMFDKIYINKGINDYFDFLDKKCKHYKLFSAFRAYMEKIKKTTTPTKCLENIQNS